jgi:hypothetical protein
MMVNVLMMIRVTSFEIFLFYVGLEGLEDYEEVLQSWVSIFRTILLNLVDILLTQWLDDPIFDDIEEPFKIAFQFFDSLIKDKDFSVTWL